MIKTREELKEYEETTKLLNDMLDSNEMSLRSERDSSFDLIKELFERCEKYQTMLKQMPSIIDCSERELMGKNLIVIFIATC